MSEESQEKDDIYFFFGALLYPKCWKLIQTAPQDQEKTKIVTNALYNYTQKAMKNFEKFPGYTRIMGHFLENYMQDMLDNFEGIQEVKADYVEGFKQIRLRLEMDEAM